jgi:uncharacterized coiled-coil DUF342 family protein
MSEQQNGVSSGTAGGAAAPDPIGTVRAVDGVVFVLGHNPDYGRRWWPVEGGGQYEDGEQWRQDSRPIVGAVPGTPAARDPRDAEIERLRGQLDDLSAQRDDLAERLEANRNARDTFRRWRDNACADWKRADAEVARLVEAARADEQREFEAYAELLNPIREVFGKSPVGASHYRELRDAINRLIGTLKREREADDAVTAEVTRLKRLVGDENVPYDGWDGLSRHDAIVRCEEGWQEYVKVRDERDRLRAERDELETKLIDVSADWERLRAALGALREDFNAAVDALTEPPTEPRRWVAGDPEPEIGTRALFADGKIRTRRASGWHYDDCPADCHIVVASTGAWTAMVNEGPVVEVVSTDG